jgi:hypothetical protein
MDVRLRALRTRTVYVQGYYYYTTEKNICVSARDLLVYSSTNKEGGDPHRTYKTLQV